MGQDCPTFILWKWKSKTYRTTFTAEHVNLAAWMLTKHGVPLENIILITDDPAGCVPRTFPLWSDHGDMVNISGAQLPSCYRRLKIFDSDTLAALGIDPGTRVVSFDLDAVILQRFLDLFNRPEPYIGWKVPGSKQRVVFNGSMFLFTAGQYDWVWQAFDAEASPTKASQAGYMGSDQAFLSHQLVHGREVGGWQAAPDGVLSYTRDVLRQRLLPKHGRVVFFPGKNKPWMPETQRFSSWIKRFYPEPGQLEAWVKEQQALKAATTHAYASYPRPPSIAEQVEAHA